MFITACVRKRNFIDKSCVPVEGSQDCMHGLMNALGSSHTPGQILIATYILIKIID
jgi:hypothetical protein